MDFLHNNILKFFLGVQMCDNWVVGQGGYRELFLKKKKKIYVDRILIFNEEVMKWEASRFYSFEILDAFLIDKSLAFQ